MKLISCVGCVMIWALMPALAVAQKVGTSTYTMTPPLGDATAAKPLKLKIPFPNAAPPPPTTSADVDVLMNKFNPAAETPVQASARKATAIKDAVDAAKLAGTLPAGVTAATMQLQVPIITGVQIIPNPPFPPIRRPIIMMVPGYSTVTFGGVASPVTVKADPTKQAGSALNFVPGAGVPVQPGPSYSPSMNRSGSSSGLSTGLDPSGGESFVGFGFYDNQSSNPPLYLVAISPGLGKTHNEVLQQIRDDFNALFLSSGYSLSVDAQTDALKYNGSRPWTDAFWFANSDAGLDFSVDMTPVPEPSTLALAGWAAAVICCRRRRRTGAIR